MILDYLSTLSPEKFDAVFPFEPVNRPDITSVDWLRCTNTKIDLFHNFVKKFHDLLYGVGFRFVDTGRGKHGYNHCWEIRFHDQSCGLILADSLNSMGGLFELSGVGCQVLQARWDLWQMFVAGLNEHLFKIKRLDVACDFKGSLWDMYGKNMIDVSRFVRHGGLTIGNGRGAKPAVNLVGDWLEIVSEGLRSNEYCPQFQATNGLTINVGSSTSANSWCIYEKGKQLAGKNPDRHDGSLYGWIRFERRFTSGRGRSEVVIPFDFAVMPDQAIVYNCEGFKDFIQDWEFYQESKGVMQPAASLDSDIDLERVGLSKKVNVKRSALHVARQSGRFFKTLDLCGIDVLEFVQLVKKSQPTKGFEPDMYQPFDVTPAEDIMNYLRDYYNED